MRPERWRVSPLALPEGICHICGTFGPLTFEHIPPESAGNDRRVRVIPLMEAMDLGPDDPRPRGKIQQRGAGAYTLCGECNSKTGKWYIPAYNEWVLEGWRLLGHALEAPSLTYIYHVLPLAVIKQIAVMMFSLNNPRFHEKHPELVRFVLNREQTFLPPRYRFFAYLNFQGYIRNLGFMAIGNLLTGKIIGLTEMAFPPFGYVMTIESGAPDERLCEITHFARCGWREYRGLQLHMPVLPTWLQMPGDYRTREELAVIPT